MSFKVFFKSLPAFFHLLFEVHCWRLQSFELSVLNLFLAYERLKTQESIVEQVRALLDVVFNVFDRAKSVLYTILLTGGYWAIFAQKLNASCLVQVQLLSKGFHLVVGIADSGVTVLMLWFGDHATLFLRLASLSQVAPG